MVQNISDEQLKATAHIPPHTLLKNEGETEKVTLPECPISLTSRIIDIIFYRCLMKKSHEILLREKDTTY